MIILAKFEEERKREGGNLPLDDTGKIMKTRETDAEKRAPSAKNNVKLQDRRRGDGKHKLHPCESAQELSKKHTKSLRTRL